jgi:hypothetical protein
MFTVTQIQETIFNQTGIKTSVRQYTGSMKNHIGFRPMLQNGIYPVFPHEWAKEFIKQFEAIPGYGNYTAGNYIDIVRINFSDFTPLQYKKERKPKTIEEQKIKGWGSKNSQVRLDKAAARYAKALRNGNNRARYY